MARFGNLIESFYDEDEFIPDGYCVSFTGFLKFIVYTFLEKEFDLIISTNCSYSRIYIYIISFK